MTLMEIETLNHCNRSLRHTLNGVCELQGLDVFAHSFRKMFKDNIVFRTLCRTLDVVVQMEEGDVLLV